MGSIRYASWAARSEISSEHLKSCSALGGGTTAANPAMREMTEARRAEVDLAGFADRRTDPCAPSARDAGIE
jgi:hypothetical protein